MSVHYYEMNTKSNDREFLNQYKLIRDSNTKFQKLTQSYTEITIWKNQFDQLFMDILKIS